MVPLDKLNNFETIYLGFSGGLDSCVLLHLLSQNESIQKKLVAVHINHGLSPEADNWTTWTEQVCKASGVMYKTFSVKLDTKKNLEESARKKRYAIFEHLLKSAKDILLLAHHQNDQAETVLLHLFRGAGVDGLAAMPKYRALGKGHLYRPLLGVSREDLRHYAIEKKLEWVEDHSNQDNHFDRNFLRNEIIPQLQKRWPSLVANLSRSAENCAVVRKKIKPMIESQLSTMVDERHRLSIHLLVQESRDTQMMLLRSWLEKQHFKKPSRHSLQRVLDELIPAPIDASPLVAWNEGEIRRYQGLLYALKREQEVLEPSILLAPFLKDAQTRVEIRYRQGGEKIRLSGKTRDLKKLFQLWKIPPWERHKIPLIYVNDVLTSVYGWATCDELKLDKL